jgi:uncharacterized protein (TIGR03435 family)
MYASLIALSLLMGSTLLCAGVAAQETGSPTAGKQREVKFEVISLRPVPANQPAIASAGLTPDGFTSQVTVWWMIMFAYAPGQPLAWINGHGTTSVSNGPSWLDDRYSIDARVSDADRGVWSNQSAQGELLGPALRDVLKERFNLVIHERPTQVGGLQLVVRKKGPRLKATIPEAMPPKGRRLKSGGLAVGEGKAWHYYGATMDDLVSFLSLFSVQPVFDKTGLTGHYDFTIQSVDHPSHEKEELLYNWPVDGLGLELKSGKGPGLNLVIDHIDKPAAN